MVNIQVRTITLNELMVIIQELMVNMQQLMAIIQETDGQYTETHGQYTGTSHRAVDPSAARLPQPDLSRLRGLLPCSIC